MATPNASDSVVMENEHRHYTGQVRAGTQTRHGRGTWTGKGAYSGHTYEGEFKDDRWSGQGVYTWPSGMRYEGEYKCGARSGRGLMRLHDGRVFDGTWVKGRPLQGTALEPDGALFRARFNGRTWLTIADWGKAVRAVAGRVAAGGPPATGGGSGPAAAEWEGRVEMAEGTSVEGWFRGLRPHGRATVTEPGGAAYAAEYDGKRTIAEGPVPVRVMDKVRLPWPLEV